jgi:hypothetical protein
MVERTAQIYLLALPLGDVQPIPQHVSDIEVKFFRATHGLPTDD